MKESTRNAIETLLNADGEVTPAEMEAFSKALGNRFNDYITAAEACAILGGICKDTLKNYVNRGRIRAIRQSAKRIIYSRAEIEAFASKGI